MQKIDTHNTQRESSDKHKQKQHNTLGLHAMYTTLREHTTNKHDKRPNTNNYRNNQPNTTNRTQFTQNTQHTNTSKIAIQQQIAKIHTSQQTNTRSQTQPWLGSTRFRPRYKESTQTRQTTQAPKHTNTEITTTNQIKQPTQQTSNKC